ncbi:hypothetical protein FHG87_001645 [Trinorchestia longiramus]|nr:hypothetical protein FHG87_001645 [Trinorchestia longiramus]
MTERAKHFSKKAVPTVQENVSVGWIYSPMRNKVTYHNALVNQAIMLDYKNVNISKAEIQDATDTTWSPESLMKKLSEPSTTCRKLVRLGGSIGCGLMDCQKYLCFDPDVAPKPYVVINRGLFESLFFDDTVEFHSSFQQKSKNSSNYTRNSEKTGEEYVVGSLSDSYENKMHSGISSKSLKTFSSNRKSAKSHLFNHHPASNIDSSFSSRLKFTPLRNVDDLCHAFSFGIGSDTSYDFALLQFGCKVFSFDMTLVNLTNKIMQPNWNILNLGINNESLDIHLEHFLNKTESERVAAGQKYEEVIDGIHDLGFRLAHTFLNEFSQSTKDKVVVESRRLQKMWRTHATSATLVAAVWLVSTAHAGWPLCKQRCDSSYNKEQLLEHPGVASVCHRGCEFFTVALLASPHGGLPLLEKKLSLTHDPINFNLEPKLTTLLEGPSKKTEMKGKKGKQHGKKEEGMLYKKLEHENVKTERTNDVKLSPKLPGVMKKGEKEKSNIKGRLAVIQKQKTGNKEKEMTVDKKSIHVSDAANIAKPDPTTSNNVISHQNPKVHQQHIHFIKPFSPPYNSALKTGIVKIPIKILEGAPAKQILAEAREAGETVVIEPSKSHGPVRISSLNSAKEQSVKGTQVNDESKGQTTKMALSKKVSHGPVSKTTVQPASHPVQDHPVHASRQITTDSSGTDERKTTTPQSSNPSLPLDHKTPEFDVFAKLANKLGSSVKKTMHPLIRLSLDEPKSIGIFPAPQKISIIEIIKKKNNIDFEKLHQEHMEDAMHCPMIFERFEEAKHSCRLACTKAYSAQKEQEACVAGCQLQASSSTDQVRTQLAEPALDGPDGIFSAIRQMFSSFASRIGQSLYSTWSAITNSRKDNGQLHSGFGAPELPLPRGFGTSELKAAEKQPSHVELEVYIEKSGPRTVQKKTIIGPKGRVIDAETIVHVSGHSSPLTPGQMLHQQLENHKKMMHQEMEMQGKLLAEDPSSIEIELNKQLEVMGKHLTKNAKKIEGEHPFFQPFFNQFLLPKINNKDDPEPKSSRNNVESIKEKQDSYLFGNLFPFPSTFTSILRTDEKKNNGLETDDLMFRHNAVNKDEKKIANNMATGEQSEKSDSQRNAAVEDIMPVQQMDLLDCISRKSGLPHWLIVFSLYTSVLVVFWLCFLLYAYVVELKECKNKVPTMVCDAGEPLMDDCCETKKLLPADECFEIRVKTV